MSLSQSKVRGPQALGQRPLPRLLRHLRVNPPRILAVTHPRSGPSDTDSDIEAILVAEYRQMSPRDKMPRVLACNAAADAMAMAGLRARHGPLSERELRFRLGALRLGAQAMKEAFDWSEQDSSPSPQDDD
jgi:hypothetical protein